MRFHRYECDRCGKKYDANHMRDPQGRSQWSLTGIGTVTTKREMFRVDLCDDCLGSLHRWLGDPNAIVITVDTGADAEMCCCCETKEEAE